MIWVLFRTVQISPWVWHFLEVSPSWTPWTVLLVMWSNSIRRFPAQERDLYGLAIHSHAISSHGLHKGLRKWLATATQTQPVGTGGAHIWDVSSNISSHFLHISSYFTVVQHIFLRSILSGSSFALSLPLGPSLRNATILSIGTGFYIAPMKMVRNWGWWLWNWVNPTLNQMMNHSQFLSEIDAHSEAFGSWIFIIGSLHGLHQLFGTFTCPTL